MTEKISVLVTGASGGIGQAIALQYANPAYLVAVHYSGSKAKAEATLTAIEAKGGSGYLVQGDISQEIDVERIFSEVKEQAGKVDILINNAGMTKDGLMMRMKEADFDQIIAVNLKGTFLMMKAASKLMMRAKTGSIVNISSVVGSIGNPGQINYVASKAAIEGMTKTAAKELASRGIRVNAVAPGFIETDMTENLSDQVKELMLQNIPLAHYGTPEDVAAVVYFLTRPEAKYLTGQTLHVDGGLTMF
ncbi:3-oxoacyl-[acyl-carrier-protein] reductase [Isobaculum melis]|uniref:3-oxoacyl-[acyl-carrier-protein] reductase n=1 Tax=Isobaculum melis TaxID=142588 RepID=A0A1H9RB65_9LACT|nr:3-oxoacyl-[acyl-carrier-protein] reductase [Isobaculum melis]SER69930.1 3-oxoacyl-[acyl-carrier-protein] reductase [Isobaculum melis]